MKIQLDLLKNRQW